MSEDEKGFLARWSQRKREAGKAEPEQVAAEALVQTPPEATPGEAQPPFDLESLPKLEDLTANTDMTVFFRKGVPESIRNAALRKSWALDPAIRNYVNPALDYAYDWNTPGGVPGSGEIGAGMDVARMVSQIMGSGEPAAEPAAAATDPAMNPAGDPALSAEHASELASQESAPDLPNQALRLTDAGISMAQNAADTDQDPSAEAPRAARPEGDSTVAPQQVVRRHGSAKPIV